MTASEAYHKLVNKWPDLDAVTCHEYKTLYVFCVVPRGATIVKDAENRFGSLCSVNKKTGKVLTFQPFHISLEEYMTGKKVKKFK